MLLDYVGGRIRREVRPDRVVRAHPELASLAAPVANQVKQLRDVSESLLRKHRNEIMERLFQFKRLADSVADIYAQIAVLSRVTSIFEEQGVEPSGRSATSPRLSALAPRVGWIALARQIEENDDERMTAIAKLAYRRGAYGYAFFED